MGFWETVWATLFGGVMATGVIAVITWIVVRTRQSLKKKPDWTLYKNDRGEWWIRREKRREAFSPMYSLGKDGTNIMPNGGAPQQLRGGKSFAKGEEQPLGGDWDHLGLQWNESPLVWAGTGLNSGKDEYPLFGKENSRRSRWRSLLRALQA